VKLTDYLQTREGALKENRYSRIAILVMAMTVCVLAIGLAAKDTTVVMVPPTLEEGSTVSATAASRETQVAWGMYLTSLLGNVTPRSAPFLKQNLTRHLSSRLYTSVTESVDRQIKDIQQEQISLSFTPTVARFDDELQKVVITGELVIRGLRGQEKRELRTYELGFVTRNYNVMLNSMRITQGQFDARAAREAMEGES